MNQKASAGIMLILLLVSLSVCTSDLKMVQAISNTVLYIEPSSIINPSLTPGHSFTVDVAVADVEFLFAWQVNMSYNTDVLEFIDVTEGDFLANQPDGTFGAKRIEESWALFGWSTIGDHQGVNGSGVLATVEFYVEAVGESPIEFELGGLNLTYLVAQSKPSPPPNFYDIEFMAEDGYFSNGKMPTIYVNPPNVINSTLTPGTSFTVDIMMSDANYDGGTDVQSWQVCMVWDPLVVDIDDTVMWGDFLDVPRIGWWGHLITDSPAGQKTVNVADGRKFANPSAWGGVVLIQDDFNSEWNEIDSVIGGQLTMKNDLANTYTMADNGGCYPKPDLFTSAAVNPTRTRMIAGMVTLGPAPGVSGDGWLCTFTFHVQDYGESDLDIDFHPVLWSYTYIVNTLLETLGDDEGELNKGSGFFSNVDGIQYTLTIGVSGFGTTHPAPGAHLYAENAEAPIVAIPHNGWLLDYWLLDGVNVGFSNPYTVTMDADHTLTAIFIEGVVPYTLTIDTIGSGTTNPAPGTHMYDDGSEVSVDAIPDDGWMLNHWLLDDIDVGYTNPYTVTMDVNHTLVAVFSETVQYALTIGVVGAGTTSPAPGTHMYAERTLVPVDAAPDGGWLLDHWLLDGVDVGSPDPYPVTMDINHVLIAVFARDSPTLIHVDPSAISVEPGDSFVLNVSIQNVVDLYAYSVTLGFDETILEPVNVEEGSFIRDQTPSPLGTYFTYIIGDDYISATCLTIGQYLGVHGSGDLFAVAFNVTDYGKSALDLSDSVLLDSSGVTMPHDVDDGYFDSRPPIIHPEPGQFANYSMGYYPPYPVLGWWNVSYNEYVEPHVINTTFVYGLSYPDYADIFWLAVDKRDRMVTDGNYSYWNQTWFWFWIETNVTVGSTIKWMDTDATIVGSEVINVMGGYVDCWVANVSSSYSYYTLSFYDKQSGVMMAFRQFQYDLLLGEILLDTTNIPIAWIPVSTELYFNLSPNPAVVGETVTMKGILVNEFSQPLSNETVQLYGRRLAGSWRLITALTTSADGSFMWQAEIPVEGIFIFAAYYPGSEKYESTYSFTVLIVR